MTKPFVYLIGWKNLDTWYCGVRYKHGCHPSDLWKTYFTSSKHVKNFRKLHGEPDHIEILKEFDNFQDAYNYEQEKLKEFDVLNKNNWLNKRVGYKFKYGPLTDEIKRKISNSNIGKHYRVCSEETKLKIRLKLLGRPRVPHTEESKRKMSESKKGKSVSFETKQKIAHALTGRKQSEETKQKRANSHKGTTHKKFSEEAKLKMSISQKKRWNKQKGENQ